MADDERVVRRTERVELPASSVTPPSGYFAAETDEIVTVARDRRDRRSGGDLLERLIIFVFGLLQGLLVLRIVLLLVAARQGNDLVSAVYGISDVFVAPFRGILRTNVIDAGRTELDVAAIVAIIGYTILEIVILGFIRVFRRA